MKKYYKIPLTKNILLYQNGTLHAHNSVNIYKKL